MLRPELPHIKNHIVKDDKFLASLNHIIEFMTRDSPINFSERLLLAFVNLKDDLEGYNKDTKGNNFYYN
jgi:hypothetical protein